MSQMGLSAGSLSHGMLDWVKNIAWQKKNLNKHQKIDYDASSAFAILWELVFTLLSDEMFNNFNEFIKSIGLELRVDGNNSMEADLTV